jgi:hypothetical protein
VAQFNDLSRSVTAFDLTSTLVVVEKHVVSFSCPPLRPR